MMPQGAAGDVYAMQPNMYATSYQMQARHEMTVEIHLDAELLSTFCRRGRRRLREIQNSSKATLKLDRTRSLLQVSGSESAIAEVRRQLECLDGPRKPIAAALWAELMRTRTVQDVSIAAIECIQQHSGCRVHIERSKHEVRLFGPKQSVAVASRLLDELGQMCSERAVTVQDVTSLASEVLHQIAHACSVTLRVDQECIFVLGLMSAVNAATADLNRYISNPQNFQLVNKPEAMKKLVADCLRLLKLQYQVEQGYSSVPNCNSDDSDSGVGYTAVRPQVFSTFPTESSPKSCVQRCSACDVILSGNFCVNCGKANPNGTVSIPQLAGLQPQNMSNSMNLAAVAAFNHPGSGSRDCNLPADIQPDMAGVVPFPQNGMIPVCIPAGMMMMQQANMPKANEFKDMMSGGNSGDAMQMYMVPVGIMPSALGMPTENMRFSGPHSGG